MQPQSRPGVQGFTGIAACDPKDGTPNLDYTGLLCSLTYVAKSQQHKGCISPLEPKIPHCCSRMQWVVEDTYTLLSLTVPSDVVLEGLVCVLPRLHNRRQNT